MELESLKWYMPGVLDAKSKNDIEYAMEQRIELVKCANDIIYFCENYFKIFVQDQGGWVPWKEAIVPDSGGWMGMWDFQKDFLRLLAADSNVIAKWPRQVGKSTCTRAYLLWYVLFNKNKTCLILANKEDMAIEQLDLLKESLYELPYWMQGGGIAKANTTTLTLGNSSRILARATSKDAARGLTLAKVYCDEFAFIDDSVADPFFAAVYPTISTGRSASMIITSCVVENTTIFTPSGIRKVGNFINDAEVGGYRVDDYSVMGAVGVNRGSIMHNNGYRETRKIASASARLECTLNHKLWVRSGDIEGWLESENLAVGDLLSIKYGMNLWGDFDWNISGQVARIVGARISGLDVDVGDIDLGDQNLVGDLMGMYGNLGELPIQLLSMSRGNMIDLLRGILSAARIYDDVILYESASERLVDQIRAVLINLGILSRLHGREVDGNVMYELTITGMMLERYHLIFSDNTDADTFEEEWIWEPVESIVGSEAYTYDFSLDDVDGDAWCHSVLYNGIIGHQTPNGTNHFYRMWQEAESGKGMFRTHSITWDARPDRTAEWARKTKETIGDIKFAAEYMCEFHGSVATLLNSGYTAYLMKQIKMPHKLQLSPQLINEGYEAKIRMFEVPLSEYEMDKRNWMYLACQDTSMGMKQDYSVLQIFRVQTNRKLQQVAVLSTNDLDPAAFNAKAMILLKAYHFPALIVEANGPGDVAIENYVKVYEYENLVSFDPTYKRRGLVPTWSSKTRAIIYLKAYLEKNLMMVYDRQTVTELSSYSKIADRKWGNKGALHDDHVTSIMWIPYYLNSPKYYGEIDEDELENGVSLLELPNHTSVMEEGSLEAQEARMLAAAKFDKRRDNYETDIASGAKKSDDLVSTSDLIVDVEGPVEGSYREMPSFSRA